MALTQTEAANERLNALLDAWYDGEGSDDLHDHLGMTLDEYTAWLNDSRQVPTRLL